MTEQQGRWVEPEVNYVDPERRFCAYCGRPIARRYWAVDDDSVAFCSPDHAERKAAASAGAAQGTLSTAGTPGR